MTIIKAIEWLYSYSKYGSKLGLDRIATLLQALDNPHKKIQTIHVTGTNGKGSVCRFIGSILSQAGYTTGVYLSPHLEHFSERISIDGTEISDTDIVEAVQKIRPIVQDMEKTNDIPTFFEIVTALAFYYFHKKSVDYVVVEVGLGGRFDATNVITPLLSIITNISLEHTQYLGDEVTSVAYEKAGIIKTKTPVISAAEHEALLVIKAVAKEKQAPMIHVTPETWKRTSHSLSGQEFHIKGSLKDYQVQTSLLGIYQGENIANTIYAIEQLQRLGVYITDTDIFEGIAHTGNPGRMELLAQHPMIILDGAHNPNGMQTLSKSLKTDFHYNKIFFIIGILKDKNIQEMLASIYPSAEEIIFTKSQNPRSSEPTELETIAHTYQFTNTKVYDDLPQAIQHALNKAKKTDCICIAGSLFIVGEARSYILQNQQKITKNILR